MFYITTVILVKVETYFLTIKLSGLIMSELPNIDNRLCIPYSIGTGIPKGGDQEIGGYLQSLRVQGVCVVERVIPEDQVNTVRESVHEGRRLLQQDREAERSKRIELERQRNPDAEIATGLFGRRWRPTPSYATLRATRPSPSISRTRACSGWLRPCSTRMSVFRRRRSISRRGRPARRCQKSSCGGAVGIPTGRMI